jgi:hypothetical protein
VLERLTHISGWLFVAVATALIVGVAAAIHAVLKLFDARNRR